MPTLLKSLAPMIMTCVFAGVVLAILAPLGTHSFDIVYRFIFWIGLCLAGGFGAAIVNWVELLRRKKFSRWLGAFYQSITATLAVSSAIFLITYRALGEMPSLNNFFLTIFYVWVISMTITTVGALLAKRSEPAGNTPPRPALYERLAPKLRSADIYALAAEDHYVRVMTSNGDELVLMRLSDAIKETTPLPGLSPHRSWWVAEAGVDKVTKSEIVLKSGQTVPISRNGMKTAREAGWI